MRSPGTLSDLMIQKDSQNSESGYTYDYGLLQQTNKQKTPHRLKSAKEKGVQRRAQEKSGASFQLSSLSGIAQTVLNFPSNNI